MMLKIADFMPEDLRVERPATATRPKLVHLFEEKHCLALWAAHAAGRPLLVRGEPGTGKSQLARAIAAHLNWAFVSEVIQGGAEVSDLHWHYDAVGRLGAAQAQASLLRIEPAQSIEPSGRNANTTDACAQEFDMDPLRYLSPGVFWWAFDWKSANLQHKHAHKRARPKPDVPDDWNPKQHGVVVLIDEIDKADPDLPNGLLETLNGYRFNVPYLDRCVEASDPSRMLVVITTNEERELPWAFLRRCLVLRLEIEKSEKQRIAWLAKRGLAHFGDRLDPQTPIRAAELLWQDRDQAERDNALFKPGLAEYLDLLRAVTHIDPEKQVETLDRIGEFVLDKSNEEF